MQIVLISPYSSVEATGLRTLSACLKQAGHTTRMIFLPDVAEAMASIHYGGRHLAPALLAQIVDLCADADLVGISVMTPSFHLACEVTEGVRAVSSAPILWGGIHPTAEPRQCLEHADLVCVGEGEALIVELATRLEAGRDYADLSNLAYLDSAGALVVNPLGPLNQELDALPFPDFAYEEHYVAHDGEIVPFSLALLHYYLTDLGSWAAGPVYGVFSARGCPYRCTYCANNILAAVYPTWGKLRTRTPASVVAEIQAARRRMPGITAVIVRDDTFLALPYEYIAEFARLYRDEVGLPFRVYTTAQTADPQKLQLLADIGVRFYIIMGIQTGSAEIQQQYARAVSNERMLRAAEVIHQFDDVAPRPMYDVITDNPYETDEDRWATLQLIHQLPKPYRLSLFSLTFYPGTDLHQRAQADGIYPSTPDPFVHNCQIVRPGYYNLALFCHGLNLPQPLLDVLASRPAFALLRRQPFDALCGLGLRALLKLRVLLNRQTYARRRHLWLAEG